MLWCRLFGAIFTFEPTKVEFHLVFGLSPITVWHMTLSSRTVFCSKFLKSGNLLSIQSHFVASLYWWHDIPLLTSRSWSVPSIDFILSILHRVLMVLGLCPHWGHIFYWSTYPYGCVPSWRIFKEPHFEILRHHIKWWYHLQYLFLVVLSLYWIVGYISLGLAISCHELCAIQCHITFETSFLSIYFFWESYIIPACA